jgi:arylsulfatase A-like enzyme/Tfp pilus assembly protein PilF
MGEMAARFLPEGSPRYLVHSSNLLLLVWIFLAGCGGEQIEDKPAAKPAVPLDSVPASTISAFEETPATEVATPRSFLLITLDTTRVDHLEPYNGGSKTPHLLELAARGGLFEQAWAVSPVTLPSHATLLTGLLPHEHGVRNNGIHYLAEENETLAEILRGEDFRTAAFVSAAVLDRRYGLHQGFEIYDDDFSAGKPREQRLNAERPAAATVNTALAWLSTLKPGEAFFLWVHLFDPHAAYSPPEPWASQYSEMPYDGEIAYMDAEVGRLLKAPELSSGSPLVMVVADHGESLGEHGESTHSMLAYQATLHIPWLVHLPGASPGRRWDQPVSQVDLLPTALELLGVEHTPGKPRSGSSLAEIIRGASPETGGGRTLYAETLVPLYTYGWSPLRTLRRGRWKYIEAPEPELYDLAQDPSELENLAHLHVEKAEELARALEEFAGKLDPGRATLVADSETAVRLRSLGYLASSAAPRRFDRPDPKTVIALHGAAERAQYLFFEHDFEGASSELSSVLRHDPENLVALASLARVRAAEGQFDAAARLATRALALDPQNLDLLVIRGLVESSRGNLEAALEAFEAALILDPHWLDARQQAVAILARLGRREEAVERITALLAEEPENVRAGVAYAELVELPADELDSAERRLRRLVEREPYLADGWRVLGRVLEAGNRKDEAVAIYLQGLKYQPLDGLLHARLGTLLTRLRHQAAAGHLEKAVALMNTAPASVHYSLASLAIRRREWAEVEAQARRALTIDPDFSGSWNHLAVAFEELGQVKEALASYARALESDRENWQAEFNRGLLLRRLERFGEAAGAFERVLSIKPDHGGSHFELGVLLADPQGNPTRAAEHLNMAIAADPEGPRAEQARELLRQIDSP